MISKVRSSDAIRKLLACSGVPINGAWYEANRAWVNCGIGGHPQSFGVSWRIFNPLDEWIEGFVGQERAHHVAFVPSTSYHPYREPEDAGEWLDEAVVQLVEAIKSGAPRDSCLGRLSDCLEIRDQ